MAKRHGNFVPKNQDVLSYGFSNLHCKMRTFEWVCKASNYRDVKSYQARGSENKTKVLMRKNELQKDFKEKLGLDVFKVRKSGGTSNTGNTARVAFANPEIFSEITNFPVSLIKKLKILFDVIDTTSHEVDPDKFDEFCQSWLDEFFASNVSWNVLR